MTVASLRKKEVQRRYFLDLLNSVATAACRSGNPSSSLDIVNVLYAKGDSMAWSVRGFAMNDWDLACKNLLKCAIMR